MIDALIADTFGLPVSDPKVQKVLEILRKDLCVDEKRTNLAQRNREIDRLRASGMAVKDISKRFGLSRQTVHYIIKRELLKRKGKIVA